MEITPSVQEYFKQQNVEIILFPTTRSRKFVKIELFIEFIAKEKTYWSDCGNGKLNEIRHHFFQIHNQLTTNTSDENQALQLLRTAINQAKINRLPCVYSETTDGKFLKSMYTISPNQASAAYDYILSRVINSINNYDSFLGIMYAYNQKDRDKVSKKVVDAEKEALSDLSVTYSNQLNHLSAEFLSRSEKITEEFDTVQDKLREGQEQFISDTQSLLDSSKQRISELENLYEEKLRLQSPAKYWDDLHIEYIKKGNTWKYWSLGTSVVFLIFLSAILYNSPQYLFEKFNFNSLKATLLFALIASIGIYMIRFFVMLSTSAYHLSRDAYERYQLTHVYLSLLNSKAINESERGIVLQSIFSRSDTGLLKKDSSPTFPGSVLEQLLKNMNK